MSELREEELDALFGKAVLTHLTEEELGLYHDHADDAFRRALTAAHLQRCLLCTRRFATMQHTLATYHELPVAPESIAQLQAHLTTATTVAQAVLLALPLALFALDKQRQRQRIKLTRHGARAADKLAQEWQTEDESFCFNAEEDDRGDLIVFFDSPRLELEHYLLTLRVGPVVKEVVLKRASAHRLGAAFTLTREEREQLRDEDEPVIEALTPPTATEQ